MTPAKTSRTRQELRLGRPPVGSPGRANLFLMTNTLETGGSERQFVTITQELSRDGWNAYPGCLKRVGPFTAEVPGIAEFDVGGSFLNLRAQVARVELARHLRRNKIQIAHAFDFYSNLMLIPTARLVHVPVVIGSQRQIGDLLTGRQAAAQLMAFRRCDKIVCNSHAAGSGLISRGISEHRIVVIPNALPPAAFACASPALSQFPGIVRVGMIARMNHTVKNHAALLRIAAKLSSQYPRVEYVLAGDGPMRGSLEAMADRLGIRKAIKFLGDRRDIPSVLASIDISVLPSLSESLSNTILESMAAGKPVIAYCVGGNPELVQDAQTGILVPLNDEEGFAQALGSLISSTAMRDSFGLKAREFALGNFSVESILGHYEELYSNLLAEKSKGKGRKPRRAETSPVTLRVGIVAPTLRYVGGQSIQAKALLDRWKEDGRVQAKLIPIDPSFPRLLKRFEQIPFLRTMVRTPLYLVTLWQGMKDIEVAHIFSASYWSFLLAPAPAWLIARLRGKKVLINYHSGEARDHLQHWRSARSVLIRVDRLVVPSPYLVNVFKEFGLEAESVPNFVDFQQFRFRPRHPLRPVLICTRGFHPYYSVDLVVRSFAVVKAEFPLAKLLLLGNGPQEAKIREYVRAGKLEDVEFHGTVSRDEIHRFYDEADIFINASWLDNMPISILEAFASGTPVVSTAPEGIRYLVENERTGLLCDPGDWQALAGNVIRLLRGPDLASYLAKNAFEKSQRYRWEIIRNEWLQIYRSLRDSRLSGGLRSRVGTFSGERLTQGKKRYEDEEAVCGEAIVKETASCLPQE